jgi:hypothetical protein
MNQTVVRAVRGVAAAVLFLGTPALAGAAASDPMASRADVDALRAQMQALANRLDRLEASNARLQDENAELQALADRREAETGYLKAQTLELREQAAGTTADLEKVKGADWATRIRGRGDFRYRHERISGEREVAGQAEDAATRDRQRIRARLGFDAAVTESLKATLLLSTGADDPRGTNQTLGGASSRKQIGLDLAYADWTFMRGGNAVLGKQPYPVWRPYNSLFLDSDVNPEGGALRFVRAPWFANAYGFWVSEQYDSDPAGENSDATIFGLQGGVKFAAFGGESVLAANYYQCNACQDHSPLYANNANGNATYRVGNVNVLKYGYDILDLGAQVGVGAFDVPLTLTAGYARNLADGVEYDTAWSLGAYLGRASDPRSWEAGLAWQSIDKDALFGQIVDSDFGNGQTDSEGWVLKGGYAPVKNVLFNATYYLFTVNKDVGTELDFTRLQLDVNFRF